MVMGDQLRRDKSRCLVKETLSSTQGLITCSISAYIESYKAPHGNYGLVHETIINHRYMNSVQTVEFICLCINVPLVYK